LVFWWSLWDLAYSLHSSWIVWLRFLVFFSLTSILSLNSEILSSTCSSSAGVAFHCVFCLTKETFYFQDFCFILFPEVFHIFAQLFYHLYFYILCCHL
jgi:hypothetical protein